MAWPVTINGRTYTEDDFDAGDYVSGIPDMLEDVATFVTNGWTATSTTNLTIGTGAKVMTVQAGKPFGPGQPLRVTYTTDPTKWMDGSVTAYNQATGSLTLNVVGTAGAGTYAAWTVTIGGARIAGSAAPLAVGEGGTGGTTAAAARGALGLDWGLDARKIALHGHLGSAAYQDQQWLDGSAVIDPPSIATGASWGCNITVPGAALGDFALVSYAVSVAGLALTAAVVDVDTVYALICNQTGAPVDLASGTVRVRVMKCNPTEGI